MTIASGMLQQVLTDALHDAGIGADKFLACHARLAGDAGGDDYDVAASSLGVVVRRARDAGVETKQRGGLHHILCLAFGQAFFDVEQDEFMADSGTGDIVGTGSTYGACSYDGYFHLKGFHVVMV